MTDADTHLFAYCKRTNSSRGRKQTRGSLRSEKDPARPSLGGPVGQAAVRRCTSARSWWQPGSQLPPPVPGRISLRSSAAQALLKLRILPALRDVRGRGETHDLHDGRPLDLGDRLQSVSKLAREDHRWP